MPKKQTKLLTIRLANLYVSNINPICFYFILNLTNFPIEIQIEFIIRRVPFGRVYAIRREIDRQCLGLIRDGNTATIVDVVPNSLSARHGLPPKVFNDIYLKITKLI